MFTGIVEEVGTIREVRPSGELKIGAGKVLEMTSVGDSIAVSGVCLTVTGIGEGWFTVDVMPETLRSCSLAEAGPGSRVNLERALGAGSRLGGHIVNGHVDGTATVREVRIEGNARVLTFRGDAGLTRYMVPKGSVALDGVSLTLVEVSGARFSVSVIPHTLAETTLAEAGPGAVVNVEADIIAKYVEALLPRREGGKDLEKSLLAGGFMEPGAGG